MKKTFLFLAALAMSVVSMAASATYTKVTSNPTDWSGDYILVYETDGAARVFTGVDAANDFVEATISDNTITGEFVTLTLETTDGGYLVKINGGDNNGKYISHSANSNGLSTGTSGAVMKMSYDESVLMTNAGGAVMRYNKTSGQDRFRFYKASSYTQQQPVQLYKAGSTPTPVTLEGIVIKGTASKLEYFVGESFDPAGLEVWGIYTKTVKGDSTSQITSGITWTIDPEVLAKEDISVDVTAQYKDFTSAPFTVNNIVVKEFVQTYANTYTSNVEYTTDSKVIWDGVEYDALKMAKNTPATITVPANTKNLHIHAAAWNKEGNEWTISGLTDDVKLTVVADAGVAGYSPFTLQNDPETTDYFVINTNNSEAKEITITLPKDKRGVIFGINAEMQEGVVAAPTFTPTESEFDGSVEVTLSAEEGAEIFYALNEEVTSMNAIQYTEPIKLTETTTIYAIAKKDGKESAQVNKTYTLIPVFESLEALVTELPATETNVTVIVTITDAAIDSFYVNKSGYCNGVYVTAANTAVELFEYNVPETWVVGGKVSGKIQAQWGLYKGTAELQQWENGWEAFTYTAPVSEAALESITLSIDKDTLFQNKEFKYNGTVTANYDDESTKDVTELATFTGYDMTTLGDQLVTVSYTKGDVTKEATYTLTVIEKVLPSKYATIYTSDVELTTEGGTSATAVNVKIDGTEYDAIKAGTGKVKGACVVSIPAATKMLHFHAAAWNKEVVKLDVNGTTYDLVADAAIAGSGTSYELQNDPATQDYFTFEPKGATTITFTASADAVGFRFVLFGVNAELEEGVLAAPTFTPSATDFEGSVEVTLTAEEGAEIFYALNEEVTSMNAIQYTEPIKLTETTTIYAVAKKDGKESNQASKTYTLIPAFESLEALVTNLPATDTKVKVIVTITDAAIDSFYVTSKGQKNGVYTHVGTTVVELYEYNVPETWVVGGKVSGKIQAQWGLYKGTAELQQWENGWNAFTYTAPGEPTRIINPKANKVAKKAIVNGQIMIIRDNRTYNVLGF